MVYGLAANAAKTMVRKAGQESAEAIAGKLSSAGGRVATDVEKKATQSALGQLQAQSARLSQELAEKFLQREGADLSHLGAKLPEIISRCQSRRKRGPVSRDQGARWRADESRRNGGQGMGHHRNRWKNSRGVIKLDRCWTSRR
jgi:hypothetical protein